VYHFFQDATIALTVRLSGALASFWVICSHWTEGRSELSQALAASEGVAAAIRAKALNGAGVLMGVQGDHEHSLALCEESLALSRKLGDTQGTALSLLSLGEITFWTGSLLRSRAQLEEALAHFRGLDNPWGIATSLERLAALALEQGEYSRSRSLLEESLALNRKVGDKTRIANVLLTTPAPSARQDRRMLTSCSCPLMTGERSIPCTPRWHHSARLRMASPLCARRAMGLR
jgi:tetratricopeptide (TPR) repeat protein